MHTANEPSQKFARSRRPWYLAEVLASGLPRCFPYSQTYRLPAQRWLAPLVALLAAAGGASSCGIKATGVDECLQLERARCQSAQTCGLIADAEACERYIADQCRHGFAPELGPSNTQVRNCTAAILDIGTCAKRSGKKAAPADCAETSLESAPGDRVCDLVERPERISDCRFLATGDEDEPDASVESPVESNVEPDASVQSPDETDVDDDQSSGLPSSEPRMPGVDAAADANAD